MKQMRVAVMMVAAILPGWGSTAFGQDKPASGTTPMDQTYRLTYTMTESDGGKRVGIQHFSMTITSSTNYASVKLGSKVPIATGSYTPAGGSPANGSQTQFTYLDVGLNIKAKVSSAGNGHMMLESQVEQSGVAESVTIATVNEPVIRQALLQNTAELTLGKAVMLGSLDTPGSTRHMDVEVVMEVVK